MELCVESDVRRPDVVIFERVFLLFFTMEAFGDFEGVGMGWGRDCWGWAKGPVAAVGVA